MKMMNKARERERERERRGRGIENSKEGGKRGGGEGV
jgi:hypothetical protein